MRRALLCKAMVALFLLGSISSVPIDTKPWGDSSNQVFAADGNNTTTLGWVSSIGGPLNDFIHGSVSLENGSSASAGWFQGNLQFRDQIDGIGASGGSEDTDFFIVWMDENGSVTSAVSGGSAAVDTIDAIDVMPNGDLLVAGTYCLNSAGDSCQLNLGDLSPLLKEDADDDGNTFLARLNASGSWIWSTQVRNSNELFVIDMMVSESNEIHLAVNFRGPLQFNGSLVEAPQESSLLVATYDENGQVLSYVVADSEGGIEVYGSLCSDSTGQMYIAVSFRGTLQLEEYRISSAGSTDVAIASYSEFGWNWAISGGGIGEDRVWDCDGKSITGIRAVGEFSGNASFGSKYTTQSSGVDFFVGEISHTGGWVNLIRGGGVGIDRATSIVHSPQGGTFVAGTTSAGLTLGPDTLEDLDSRSSDTYNDIFLAELLENNTWEWALQAGGDGNDEATSLSLGYDGSPQLSFVYSGSFEAANGTSPNWGGYDSGVWLYQTDRDNDGLLDGEDNCPRIANPGQGNHDNDLAGDLCDEDDDNDNLRDEIDDCPFGDIGWFSEASTDHDSDGCKDATEDYDDDEDTIFDHNDACPLGPVGWISTPEVDSEGDGCADIDSDGDQWVDQMDNCPDVPNPEQLDLDEDNIGDMCDIDEDGDSIANPEDNCPRDSPLWTSTSVNDYDQDGCHDSLTDFDDDEDGVGDADDACPRGEIRWSSSASIDDYDGDGCRDLSEDEDDDQDGIVDVIDNCPTGIIGIAALGQDLDGDGCIDSDEDVDDDEDGVLDEDDLCPRTVLGQEVGITGCSQYQLDDDLDGISNAEDLCLNTIAGKIVDQSGCQIVLGNTVNNDSSSNNKLTMSSVLYLFAGLFICAAVYVSIFNKPPVKEKDTMQPLEQSKSYSNIDELSPNGDESEGE
tara:strand:+ start:7861 stop:10572 length:2712 start_codon:yes stop_codon:yes gene_type:complete